MRGGAAAWQGGGTPIKQRRCRSAKGWAERTLELDPYLMRAWMENRIFSFKYLYGLRFT